MPDGTAMRRQWSWLLALIAAFAGPAGPQPRNLGLVSYKEPVVPKLEIDASAVVAFTIRANGRVADAVTLTATNRVLGASAREAVLEFFRQMASASAPLVIASGST